MERHLVTCPVCKTDQHIYGGKICNHIGADGFGCPGSREPLKATRYSLKLIQETAEGILNQDDWVHGPTDQEPRQIAQVWCYSGQTRVVEVVFYDDLYYTIKQQPVGVRHLQDAMTYGRVVSLIQALAKKVPNMQEFMWCGTVIGVK